MAATSTDSTDDRCPVGFDAEEPEVADAAGLRYVNDDEPGWTRRRCGTGFTYLDDAGRTLRGADRDRAEALVIPPAWTDVWIAPDDDAHLLATGRDDAGRKQYLYHPRWREVRDEQKFAKLGLFGARLTRLRKRVTADLASTEPTLERAAAAAVRMMDRGLLRVGNDQYAEDMETFGATTIEHRHVEVDGDVVVLDYTAKGDIHRHLELVDDPALARAVEECAGLDGAQVLCGFRDGRLVDLTSDHVNTYVELLTGISCTAKDFRTWGGTVAAAETLGPLGEEAGEDDLRDAVDHAAEVLGNTRAVARSSYVAPQVLDAARTGELQDTWRSSRTSQWMSRGDRTCAKVLAP